MTLRSLRPPGISPVAQILSVHVQPGARNSAWVGWKEGILHLRIHAPARDGAANTQTLAFLAEILEIPISRFQLLRGEKSRYKKIQVHGLSAEEMAQRLSKWEKSQAL
ncbi:MAG: DUF167 domain-containing protein [Acidithiobacillus sp.]|nr:DUF167 domain-containing protein [Acidithiobacillus sp.]